MRRFRYAGAPDREALARMGTVAECEQGKAVVRVAQPALRDVVSALLADPKVIDLTVEEPPLEEVLRELFARTGGATP